MIVATGVALVFLVAMIDYQAGAEVRLYSLYFVPVSFVSWYTGRRWGVVLSVLCTAAWQTSNHLSGIRYSHWAIIPLNLVLILASFLTVSLLISGRRRLFERERDRDRLLRAPLLHIAEDRVEDDNSENSQGFVGDRLGALEEPDDKGDDRRNEQEDRQIVIELRQESLPPRLRRQAGEASRSAAWRS